MKTSRNRTLRALLTVIAALLTVSPLLADTQDVYITDYSANTVYRYHSDGTLAATDTSNLNVPEAIAVDGAGNLYVTTRNGGHQIQKFSPNDTDLGTFATTGGNPDGLAINSAGDVFVANYDGNSVSRYDSSGNFLQTLSGVSGATFMACDTSGTLYVAAYGANQIVRFQQSGGSYSFLDSFGAGVNRPYGVAFNSAGDLFVSSDDIGAVMKFANLGSGQFASPTTYISGLPDAFGIGFDSSDNLFVTAYSKVYKFSSSHAFASSSDANPFIFVGGFGHAEDVAFSPASSSSPFRYTLNRLNTFGRNNTYATAINSRGEITGWAEENPTFPDQAAYWDGRTGDPASGFLLGWLPGGSFSQGRGISEAATIVGQASDGSKTVAFSKGLSGSMFNMGGSRSSTANGINDQWGVVGFANFSGSGSAFVSGSGSTSIVSDDNLGGGATSYAGGINNNGQIIGYATRPPTGNYHALLWNPNGTGLPGSQGWDWSDLGTLGGTYSYGYGINDFGQAVGQSNDGSNVGTAFLWTPGGESGPPTNPQMQDLGTLGGAWSYATGVNLFGTVIGVASDGVNSSDRAFVWDSVNQMRDLNTLLDPATASQWVLYSASGINDKGQIVGYGTYGGATRGFLLNPPPALWGLSITPAGVTGGTQAVGTVTLTSNAGPGGVKVDLSSDDTNSLVQFPSSVTVPEGQDHLDFAINTVLPGSDTLVVFLATHGNDVPQATTLTVNIPRHIAGFGLGNGGNTGLIISGASTTGFVTLDAAAPVGGVDVALSTDNVAAQLPATAHVDEGNTASANFTITTSVIQTTQTANLTGTLNGTATAVLTIRAPKIIAVDLGNGGQTGNITAGGSTTGFVTLDLGAQGNGQAVTLSSDNPHVHVPANVVVVGGQTKSPVFTITADAVTSTQTATITGTLNGSAFAVLTVIAPVPTAVNLNKTSLTPQLVAGDTTTTGTVTLSNPAPAGYTVTLSSDKAAATVPATVSFPTGATTSNTFTVKAFPVAADTVATISATGNGTTASTTLTVKTPVPTALTLVPTTVVGGSSSTAKVTLSGPTPASGYSLSLASSNSAAATVPASLAIASAAQGSFAVATHGVAANLTSNISASYNGTTKSATLSVSTATLLGLAFSATTIKGGALVKLTVTITGAAPPGGAVVQLNYGTGLQYFSSPPPTAVVPVDKSSVVLTLTTKKVTANHTVTIIGTWKSVSKVTGGLTITP